MQTMQGELSLHGTHCERCGSKMIYFMPKNFNEPAYGCSLEVCSNPECKHTMIHCPGNMMSDPPTCKSHSISNEDYEYITSRDNKTEKQLKVLDEVKTNNQSKEFSLYDTLTKELSDYLLEKIDEVKVLESENNELKEENEKLKNTIHILTKLNDMKTNQLKKDKIDPKHQSFNGIVDEINELQERIENLELRIINSMEDGNQLDKPKLSMVNITFNTIDDFLNNLKNNKK